MSHPSLLNTYTEILIGGEIYFIKADSDDEHDLGLLNIYKLDNKMDGNMELIIHFSGTPREAFEELVEYFYNL